MSLCNSAMPFGIHSRYGPNEIPTDFPNFEEVPLEIREIPEIKEVWKIIHEPAEPFTHKQLVNFSRKIRIIFPCLGNLDDCHKCKCDHCYYAKHVVGNYHISKKGSPSFLIIRELELRDLFEMLMVPQGVLVDLLPSFDLDNGHAWWNYSLINELEKRGRIPERLKTAVDRERWRGAHDGCRRVMDNSPDLESEKTNPYYKLCFQESVYELVKLREYCDVKNREVRFDLDSGYIRFRVYEEELHRIKRIYERELRVIKGNAEKKIWKLMEVK